MKTLIKLITGLLSVLVLVSSCMKIDDLQKDSAAIYNAKPQLILTGIQQSTFEEPWTTDQRHNQYAVLNFDFYGNQAYGWKTGSFGLYDQLRNVIQMEIEAAKEEGTLGKPYEALAKFYKAYFFVRLSEMFGDIPMKDALKGRTEQLYQPKYDSQKEVYQSALGLLSEASVDLQACIDRGDRLDGDLFYKGDLNKWLKLVNSYKVRTLVALSKRADDSPELKIKDLFDEMMKNPTKYPQLASQGDDFQFSYDGANRNTHYPLWPADGVVIKNDERTTLASTYVDIVKAKKDPRLFVVAWPTDSARESGDPDFATRFTSFKGGKTGELQSVLQQQTIEGKLSMINFDYWMASASGVPVVQLGVAEAYLNIAEGINRGWTTSADAADYYKKGITASMRWYGIAEQRIAEYLTDNPYKGNNKEGLQQILEEKYVAMFQNSGKQAYFQYRRTGWPKFDIGPANANNNEIPTRWAYPVSEYTVNEQNLKSALETQYGGADTQNGVMWLIK
ncbi:SusD/RagB family nutrient-binding outer membrane lipoprotein [Sphingobacterium sp. UT-1RO-CII-1]|uniref:SusD/RagB family nutrient-binding outer membrane lipoprotein n=1 Tax=Sphingobacterium sp. UT-1RO-CII-1 TaxID=2995225 RepID=UPI00227D0751|nr:SusD/RagB family nutrient-binding outer membrane lipoprotein [Sphingobacterium sp. UT-1RO-CII-1]MCY4780267.1 SusD/RagB family nutrient-binding outer membrane lipoprotein [Sphingobacterium sp. UT-1RO-CII-1]